MGIDRCRVKSIMETTFLTENQIWGDDALSVLKEYGVAAAPTDLAVILGAYLGGSQVDQEGHLSGAFWSASADKDGNVLCATDYRNRNWKHPLKRGITGRPALPKSSTSIIRSNGARPNRKIGKIQVIEYGTYPQTAAPQKIADELESAYKRHSLPKTGNKYTFDTRDHKDRDKGFAGTDYDEYTHNGKRYIRVLGRPYDDDSKTHDGRKIVQGKVYWVEVQPVEWLADPNGVWVSRESLFGGIRFNPSGNYDGNFSKTEMYQYLQKYFTPQLTQSISSVRTVTHDASAKEKFTQATRKLSHGVQVIDEPMSIKEQIAFYVKTGKSFMLHGPSGIGKTARIEAVDPDLTAVPLWNGVLPEDIVGKVRYPNGNIEPLMTPRETGEDAIEKLNGGGVWVPPDWYNELTRKCATEPNKPHVLFIDEVTNAKPTTQSLIFHIVLKKSISPSKGKLPANAVVVLAGNDKQESGAAYNMPAPLFRRMSGHIRLEYNLPEWLEWASEKSRKHPKAPSRLNAHPLIAQFLAANPQAFYSNYNEENPEQWAIDPRGWEQISDIIYDNGNTIRRELIENKIGQENAAALMAFAHEPMITLDDVVNGTYDARDIPKNADLRLATTLGLRHADTRQVKSVRQFIQKYLGAENLAIFDSLWVGQDAERAIQITQMQSFIKEGR